MCTIPDLDLHWEFAGGGHLLTINGTGCDLGWQQVVWVISEASYYALSSHRCLLVSLAVFARLRIH